MLLLLLPGQTCVLIVLATDSQKALNNKYELSPFMKSANYPDTGPGRRNMTVRADVRYHTMPRTVPYGGSYVVVRRLVRRCTTPRRFRCGDEPAYGTVRAAVRHRTTHRTETYGGSYGIIRCLVRCHTVARTSSYGDSYGAVRRLVGSGAATRTVPYDDVPYGGS